MICGQDQDGICSSTSQLSFLITEVFHGKSFRNGFSAANPRTSRLKMRCECLQLSPSIITCGIQTNRLGHMSCPGIPWKCLHHIRHAWDTENIFKTKIPSIAPHEEMQITSSRNAQGRSHAHPQKRTDCRWQTLTTSFSNTTTCIFQCRELEIPRLVAMRRNSDASIGTPARSTTEARRTCGESDRETPQKSQP